MATTAIRTSEQAGSASGVLIRCARALARCCALPSIHASESTFARLATVDEAAFFAIICAAGYPDLSGSPFASTIFAKHPNRTFLFYYYEPDSLISCMDATRDSHFLRALA